MCIRDSLRGGAPVAQGEVLSLNNNITFRLKRYPTDFAAFSGRDLAPKGYLELNPNTEFCALRVSTEEIALGDNDFKVYPNPVIQSLQIERNHSKAEILTLFDIHGRRIKTITVNSEQTMLDLREVNSGIYWLKGAYGGVKKIVVK